MTSILTRQPAEQLAVDNVIFQYCHGEFRDSKGYMAFDMHGGWEPGADLTNYKVQVFTGGKDGRRNLVKIFGYRSGAVCGCRR